MGQLPSTPGAIANPVSRYTVHPELDLRFAAFTRHNQGRRLTAATLKWYRETYAIFLKFLDGRSIGEIEASSAHEIVSDWMAAANEGERPISPFTARSYWQAMRGFFSYLERFDGFPSPFRLLQQPKVETNPFPKALSYDDCVRVLDAAQSTDWADEFERARAAAMVGVALYAGLRRGEVLRLQFNRDVNLDEQWIRVVSGKGNKSRITFIAPELEALLRTYVEARRRAHLESVEFFTARTGGKGVKVKTFTRIVERLRKTSGVRFSIHMLRHSFVTTLARNREQPHVIRELAGHADLKTTQRYTRVFAEDMRDAVNALSFRRPAAPLTAPHPEPASPTPPHTPPQTRASTV